MSENNSGEVDFEWTCEECEHTQTMKMFDIKKAAHFINKHPESLRRYIAKKQVTPINMGNAWFFTEKQLSQLIISTPKTSGRPKNKELK